MLYLCLKKKTILHEVVIFYGLSSKIIFYNMKSFVHNSRKLVYIYIIILDMDCGQNLNLWISYLCHTAVAALLAHFNLSLICTNV